MMGWGRAPVGEAAVARAALRRTLRVPAISFG